MVNFKSLESDVGSLWTQQEAHERAFEGFARSVNERFADLTKEIKGMREDFQRATRFPMGTAIAGAGLVVTIIIALAVGYVGKPLDRLEAAYKADQEYSMNYRISQAEWKGKVEAKLEAMK